MTGMLANFNLVVPEPVCDASCVAEITSQEVGIQKIGALAA
jgi:hypothetical protein